MIGPSTGINANSDSAVLKSRCSRDRHRRQIIQSAKSSDSITTQKLNDGSMVTLKTA
jgi:hypothetical protein